MRTIDSKTVSRRSFVLSEWRYIESKKELVDLLRCYKGEFGVAVWTEETIRHFLEIYHFLYSGEYPEWHHIRCIYTILSEVQL